MIDYYMTLELSGVLKWHRPERLKMIKTFAHKGLKELFNDGKTKRIAFIYHNRCIECLTLIDNAADTAELKIPGWVTHPMHQFNPVRWSMRISGNYRITFEFEKGNAYRVDFEDPH